MGEDTLVRLEDLRRFGLVFGPRTHWYVQGGDGSRITNHYHFRSIDEVAEWVRESEDAALYFEVQGSEKVSDTRPASDEIDTIYAFPIDIDPASGTRPASDGERLACFEVADKLSAALVRLGLGRPLQADSGNGAQLYVRLGTIKVDESTRPI